MNGVNDRTIRACKANGTSNIPLLRSPSKPGTTSPTSKNPPTVMELKWKQKFEESEKKRKSLLYQQEKSLRTQKDLEKKFEALQQKKDELETELFEKNENLAKLTTVSKNLYKEYDTLKNQYEVETGAMNKALSDASQWYKENKVLRRRTMLMDKDTVDEGVDTDEANCDTDLENLRESVKQMSQEIAQLQAELNSAKLLEFETSELNANLTQELESEKKKSQKLEAEILKIKEQLEQVVRVSNIMKRELEELKEQEIKEKLLSAELKEELDSYKRERNVLAHQSTILLQGMNTSEGIDNMVLIKEIEDLKSTLEDERNKFNDEINALQEKLEDQDNNSHTEILEERLKVIESELQQAIERAEKAEKELATRPALLPPPPPPPLPLEPPAVPVRTKKLARSAMPEIAATLGVQETPASAQNQGEPKKVAVGVNEEIINQIKGGTFTLKKSKSEGKKKERETPKAVVEMLNVLGSLRRVSRNKITLSKNFDDVQL